jgi:hypothetical protein
LRASSPLFDRDSFYNVGFDAYSNDVFEDDDNDDNSDNSNFSRSTSPMDLSSSPEPSDDLNKESPMAIGEPVIIGAWPRSRSSSPSVFSSSFPSIRIAPVEKLVVATPVMNESLKAVDPIGNESDDDEGIVADKDDSEKSVDNSETVQLKASLATIKVYSLSSHCLGPLIRVG